jgi:N-acetyl-1-D-myo-inositol-2-amino-2-deoxy-alpha-D-glucopyranoside deacetylase
MSEKQNEPLTFMAVHAHPDDEVFSGGIFPYLADRGVRTVLVTATLGEEGEIVDPAMDEQAKKEMFPRLGEVRREELKASVKALRISESRLLGYRDSGMMGTEANNHPESFHRAVFNEAVKRLVVLIRELKPQVIMTYDAFGGYGHPDHLQANRITNAAFEAAADARYFPESGFEPWQPSKLYYTVSSRTAMVQMINAAREAGIPGFWDNPNVKIEEVVGVPDEMITTRLNVRPYLENKVQAIRAHKTQIADEGFFFIKNEEMREKFLGHEYFILARSTIDQRTHEDDLFAGLA